MKVLFQGDSITDAGRDYADPHHLGDGYPKYAAEAIRERFPDETFEFINLGISGNRTTDLLERWQKDCIAVQPDVLSILIGINDTWRRYDSNLPMTVEEYEANYRRLVPGCEGKYQGEAAAAGAVPAARGSGQGVLPGGLGSEDPGGPPGWRGIMPTCSCRWTACWPPRR